MPCAILIGFVFIGPISNFSIWFVFPILLCLILAVLVNCIIYGCVGLLAFWIEEASPFTWIILKLQMLFGLFFPPEFCPGWLQPIIEYSPVYAMMSGPCKLLASFSWELFCEVLLSQIFYIIIFASLGGLLYKSGTKKVNVNGG